MLAFPTVAHATCGPWDANLVVTPKDGAESKGFDVGWDAAPYASCTNGTGGSWPGLDHYEIHGTDEGTVHSAYSAASVRYGTFLLYSLGTGAHSTSHFIFRPGAEWAFRVYACGNSSCTTWYGQGTRSNESISDFYRTDLTDIEQWVMTGITSETMATPPVVVDDPDANAPFAFYYTSGWGTGYSGKLALYYSKEGDISNRSEIWYQRHNLADWPDDGFNGSADWDPAILVAEGPTSHSDSDFAVSHPWIMRTRDGSTHRIELFSHSQYKHCTEELCYHENIIEVRSVGATGTDFGLSCSGSCCTYHVLQASGTTDYVAIDADGTSGTDYVEHVRHSGVAWNYIDDPYIDVGTDEPFMFLQVETLDGGHCSGSAPDDIGIADASWDSGNSKWLWDIVLGGAIPNDCPTVYIDDAHDNTNIPMQNDEFRVYYKSYDDDQWYVKVWDGSDWATWSDGTDIVEKSPVNIWWDGSFSGPSHDCVENMNGVVYIDGGVPREALFFMLQDSLTCQNTGDDASLVGLDDDAGTSQDDQAIVFAQIAN